MDFITILIIASVIGALIGIGIAVSDIHHKNKSKEVFKNLTNFNATDKYISDSSGVSIAYDKKRKKICLLVGHKAELYEYKDIIQSELDIDGETVLKQSITGTVGRSVVGGVLGGGVGAIIGGTTGKKTGKEKIKNIDLKIIVNNSKSPVYRINFMSTETSKRGFIYNISYGEAEKWHGIITTLIKQADIEQNNLTQSSISSYSIADEILKLKNLLDSEVISKAEFNSEKEKLLNK